LSNDDPEREGLDRALPVDPGSRVGAQGAVLSHRRRGRRLFERIRYRRADESVFSFAFDLLELDGQELRREPIETGKATLASLLRGCGVGLRLVEHLEHGVDVVYRLQARLRGHCVEAARLAVCQRPHPTLAQVQEPGGPGGEARGGRGMGMSYLSTTKTVTLTSDTPAILTTVPET